MTGPMSEDFPELWHDKPAPERCRDLVTELQDLLFAGNLRVEKLEQDLADARAERNLAFQARDNWRMDADSLREQLAESERERERLAAEKRVMFTVMEKRKAERKQMEDALREIADLTRQEHGYDIDDTSLSVNEIAYRALNPNTESEDK